MRGLILLFIFFLFRSEASSQGFIQAGTSLNFLDKNGVFESYKPIFGYEVRYGYIINFKNSHRLSIQPELGMTYKRILRKVGDEHFYYRWNYFAFAASANYEINKSFRMGAGFEGGSRMAFNLRGEDDLSIKTNREDWSKYDLAILLTSEYALNRRLRVGLLYNFGLIPVISYEEIGNYGEVEAKDKAGRFRSVNLSLKYLFNGGNDEQ